MEAQKNADASATALPSSWELLRPILIDIFGPFIAYAIAHAIGASMVWAMTAAGAAAGVSTAINTFRRRGLDRAGLLVVLELAAAVTILVFVHDEHLMLIRPSIYTAIASVYLIISGLFGKPLTYAGSRIMAARGGPERIAAFERTWDKSPEFRHTHIAVTIAFGVCLAIDSVLRVVIVYHFPVDRAAWLSNVPHTAAIALMIVTSALAGRRFSRLVDEQMPGRISQTGKG
jgi:hypothetical protein